MNINVGEKIKELRTAKNITQAELAERVGVTTSAVSSYEVSARQPSYDVLVKMSKLFNVTTDYLLGVTEKDVIIINVTELSTHQKYLIREIINQFQQSPDNPTKPEELEEINKIMTEQYQKDLEKLDKKVNNT